MFHKRGWVMQRFIGRVREREALERAWARNRFEFTVVYGRRRVGKTRLIREYIADKPAVYFMALEADKATNLAGISRAFSQFQTSTGTGLAGLRARHASFEDLFADMADVALRTPFVLVVDEFPYLAASWPPISSLLQKFCDSRWAATGLHLILCGSSMSFMERQVLSAKSPLYGRRSGQIRLRPFDFVDTEDFLSPMSRADAAILYAATGGVAEYLDFIDTSESLTRNLANLFFDPSGRLVEEPGNLLKQELREPKRYSSILRAIADGASKHNQIATKTGIPTGALTNYLDALIDLGIVSKQNPWNATMKTGGRQTIYRIQDGCFRFWYRFVQPNLSTIELGAGSAALEANVVPELNSFMGLGFERIVADLFDRDNAAGKLSELYQNRARWWGNDPKTRQSEEIDLVAGGTKTTLFIEAKWVGQPVGIDVLKTLENRSKLVKHHGTPRYAIYAKSGFTPELTRHATARTDVNLHSFLEK